MAGRAKENKPEQRVVLSFRLPRWKKLQLESWAAMHGMDLSQAGEAAVDRLLEEAGWMPKKAVSRAA